MARGNGLSDAYTATLKRLKGQNGNKSVLGLKVLMWILYLERPLRAEELCHALGVEIGSADLDPNNVPALRTLLASCLGLVTIEPSSSIVRLVHYTLQDYLLSNPTLFHSLYETIAEVCLTYLNFRSVWDLSTILDSPPYTLPLLEYASFNWGKHIRMPMTGDVKILALRLLSRFNEHISAKLLLLRYSSFNSRDAPTGFTGLHGVTLLGIAEIVAGVLEIKEWDVNAIDGMGLTALAWAARRGYTEVIKILLKREDVNPNQQDTKDGRTPLGLAVDHKHEGAVRMLLERKDVNPNQPDTKDGRTPLMLAVDHKHEGVIRMLLEREDINPDQSNSESNYTSLWLAIKSRSVGPAKILLERKDVDPNQQQRGRGHTPLTWAALNAYEWLAEVLLGRDDTNPNQPEPEQDHTPLTLAAANGHAGIVKMLLEREDVNADQENTNGWTPLMFAAKHSRSRIVEMLLERQDVNPNQELASWDRGHTPLTWAVVSGRAYEGLVKILLERKDVNPNQGRTESGRTPLILAIRNGNEGIVKMFLERRDVNLNQADHIYGRTPLSWAAFWGQDGIVRMLSEREDVNLSQADTRYGRTPL